MGKNANFVSHKKSKQIVDGKPKLPLASDIVEGEIAINFGKDVETLSIKNESGDVVTFSSDNYYTEQKLGSGFTGENSGVTVTEALENVEITVDQVIDSGTSASTNAVATKAVFEVIKEDERVTAEALNSLNTTIIENERVTAEALNYLNETVEEDERVTAEALNYLNTNKQDTLSAGTGIIISGNVISSNAVVNIDQVIDSSTSASTNAVATKAVYGFVTAYTPSITVDQTIDSSTSASTNAVATSAVYDFLTENYYTKDETDDGDEVISASLNDLNTRKLDASAYTPVQVDQVIDSGTSASTNAVATKAVVDKLIEDEQVWAISLNELNNKKFGYANFDSTDSTLYFYKDEDDYTSGGTEIDSVDLSDISIEIDQVIDSGTSASTGAVSTSAVYGFVTSYTPSITVDQVLDDTTSASTNPVSSKAVYDAVTDNELVWTNAYVALSGAVDTISGSVDTHKANTNIHLLQIVSAVTVSSDMSNVTCPNSITGASNNGAQALVVYENSGDTDDYTITVSTSYKTPDGNQLILTCPANGYCEVSYVNINGTIYVRGI